VREREHVLNKKVTLDIKALIKYSGQGNVSDKISTTRNGVAVGFVLVCSVGHWLSGSVF